ncbi:MAG: OmpA family protein [Nitrospirae bacterium]|nr:MAG: OmpA family protein [Nitrospirota bacterium]
MLPWRTPPRRRSLCARPHRSCAETGLFLKKQPKKRSGRKKICSKVRGRSWSAWPGFRKINLDELVDHVEFESGEATFKPEGLRILKQVSEILKAVPDKHFRVEGHADNVPIGPSLKEKFPSNWELSKARATSVVRYLIEEGGLDSASLSAVGYGDTRPAASNETEEGRQANRRVEILLLPHSPTQPSKEQPPRQPDAGVLSPTPSLRDQPASTPPVAQPPSPPISDPVPSPPHQPPDQQPGMVR